jgi:hypothetical protein
MGLSENLVPLLDSHLMMNWVLTLGMSGPSFTQNHSPLVFWQGPYTRGVASGNFGSRTQLGSCFALVPHSQNGPILGP